MSRIISYVLILVGAFVAIYAQAGEHQNQYVLIGGIVVLMMGIYRISRNIPSKRNQNNDEQNGTSL
ncbi:hypothetical protein [Psychroserpens mesophilus]|uniref:hypothetical protein n=1 Tax=Psychroserpens mesophilus TaxID=325473 RepID=UPI003D660505